MAVVNRDRISLKRFPSGIVTTSAKKLDSGYGIRKMTNVIAALRFLEQRGLILADRVDAVSQSRQSGTTIYSLRDLENKL